MSSESELIRSTFRPAVTRRSWDEADRRCDRPAAPARVPSSFFPARNAHWSGTHTETSAERPGLSLPVVADRTRFPPRPEELRPGLVRPTTAVPRNALICTADAVTGLEPVNGRADGRVWMVARTTRQQRYDAAIGN